MPNDLSAAASDALLAGYFAAADGEAARRELGRILADEASPLIWKVLRRQLGGGRGGTAEADLEDLHGDLLLKLQLQLEAARRGERAAPQDLLDYVAASAYNAVAGFHLARQPERTRLRDRVRYVLRREDRLASWSATSREKLCGLARDAGREPPADEPAPLEDLARRHVARHGAGWGRFPGVVLAMLEELDAPCRFEVLVDALCAALGVDDRPPIDLDGEVGVALGQGAADRQPIATERLVAAQGLAVVWNEILQLPSNQRFALLVNLRGEGGEALLEELLGSAAVEPLALAEAIGLSLGELEALLPQLPRDDRWIAERLGLSRQQVINLRKSARLRLVRRLRGGSGAMG